MGRLADSSLGARYLGTNPWVLVASAAYLKRCGTPPSPEALRAHEALIYSSVQGDERWHFAGADGKTVQVPVKGPLRSNNLSALLAAARAGLGLTALPWYVAHDSVRDGVLQPLLTDWTLPAQEIHAVFSSPRMVPTKVSGFVDFLLPYFGGDWWAGGPARAAARDPGGGYPTD
jgi:DNA-binding transcriptional LysR family regulator